MKKIFKTLTIIFCAVIPAVMLTSCLDNDDDGQNQILTSNFVSYEGMRGSNPVFSYTNPRTNVPVMLTGDLNNLPTMSEGDRCYMTYYLPAGVPEDAYTDCSVNILQLVVALTAPFEAAPAPTAEIPGIDIELRTMFINGNYLNLLGRAFISKNPQFTITYVPESVATGTVEVYISFTGETDGTARTVDLPASFNIGAIWSNPQVSALNIHIRNSNSGIGTSPFLIKKN